MRVADRPPDHVVDKAAVRRDELAAAALVTLSELGYARTSLRDIAANSAFSHGVFHYYFRDKVDLITHCVRVYKATCITRYDEVVADATTSEELIAGFQAKLAQTLVEEAPFHRLWYDLRTQSMFEPSFRADVAEIDLALERMIGRITDRYAELSGVELALSGSAAYAVFDGLFQQALLRQLADDPDAARDLQAHVGDLLAQMASVGA